MEKPATPPVSPAFTIDEPRKKMGAGKKAVVFLLVCLLLVVLCAAGYIAYVNTLPEETRGQATPAAVAADMFHTALSAITGEPYESPLRPTGDSNQQEANQAPPAVIKPAANTNVFAQDGADNAESASSATSDTEEAPAPAETPTPLIAEFEEVLVHSPIVPSKITGVLFHQASFDYAQVMRTQLPEANPETVANERHMDIPDAQPTGDVYLDASALHIWRPEVTEMDTSVDVGAEPGTDVLAPTTGTVVFVTEYDLFGICTDYEVHIQPDVRSDLDVVVIHISDVCVKKGDRVEGGVTPIAKVRDIAGEGVDEIQLAMYIDDFAGNHCHVQVNNANAPEYREKKLTEQPKEQEGKTEPAPADGQPAPEQAEQPAPEQAEQPAPEQAEQPQP